jgi:hypothetical protein
MLNYYKDLLIAVDMEVINDNYVINNAEELFTDPLTEVTKCKVDFLRDHGIYLIDDIDENIVTVYYTSAYGYIHECEALDLGHEKFLFWGKMKFVNIVYFADGESFEHLFIDPLWKEKVS